jgi:quercetin 2,3-dioxygenase
MAPSLEISAPHEATVGEITVGRVLPRRQRRMIGPWCFADVMGPSHLGPNTGLDVGPHPHIGLQTVTWLLEGRILHRDSLGSEQLITPGQLNLMTAGHGVSHSEETRGIHHGEIYGVQLWVAQPEETRHGAPAFEHHDDLPRFTIEGSPGSQATVIIGEFAGQQSPARRDTEHMAIELRLEAGHTVIPLSHRWEHGVIALENGISVNATSLIRGHLGYLAPGTDELLLHTESPGRVLLIGGKAFADPVLMWWNYVARSRSEIIDAHSEWTSRSARFGDVGSPLPAVDVAPPPW